MTTIQEPTGGRVALPSGSMPLLGFGTWQLDVAAAEAATAAALELGYRHVDTATMYGNEVGIGRALAASDLPRDQVFVTTKLPPDHAGRERETLERSLADLGLDHVDLWLIHWPTRSAMTRVWDEFVAAQADGLAHAIGVSNFSMRQVDELTWATGVTPAVNQIRWSPSLFDPRVVEGHAGRGMVLEGYSPFKSSDLDDPVLASVAAEVGASVPQVIVAWHVAHQFVVIPKSARRERIEANAAGAALTLTPQQITALDALGR